MPPQQLGLVLHRRAPSRRHQHVEELAIAGFLPARRVVVQRIEDLVDHARDLALRNHEVASSEGAADGGRLGLAVRPLTAEERRENRGRGGLLVEDASGAAARAGIQEGDLILSFNGTPVKSVDELKGLVAKAGKRVAILIQRGGQQLFVPVELG